MTNPVFVALDTIDVAQACEMANRLKNRVGGIKIGLEFFNATGPQGVAEIARLGIPFFLDLKLHDIPNTVAGAMKGVVKLAPRLTTIHASGGFAMMKAAADAAAEEAAKQGVAAPCVLAVTILTSIDQTAMTDIGYAGTVLDQVKRLAELAARAGVGGLVCSPHEVAAVRDVVGPDLTLVVPGIRPVWAAAGDQKRIMTPAQAIEQGADLLVIGRPITGDADPAQAADRIAQELAA